jgi:hypothetical protein
MQVSRAETQMMCEYVYTSAYENRLRSPLTTATQSNIHTFTTFMLTHARLHVNVFLRIMHSCDWEGMLHHPYPRHQHVLIHAYI